MQARVTINEIRNFIAVALDVYLQEINPEKESETRNVLGFGMFNSIDTDKGRKQAIAYRHKLQKETDAGEVLESIIKDINDDNDKIEPELKETLLDYCVMLFKITDKEVTAKCDDLRKAYLTNMVYCGPYANIAADPSLDSFKFRAKQAIVRLRFTQQTALFNESSMRQTGAVAYHNDL